MVLTSFRLRLTLTDSLTPSMIGLVKEVKRKHELLHFGYMARREAFRGGVIPRQFFLHEDTSLAMHILFGARFIIVD
jgi:hypothetical protein